MFAVQVSSTNTGYLSRDAIKLCKFACASGKKERQGSNKRSFSSNKASTHSCETNKSMLAFSKKNDNFIKYSMLSTHWSALRATLSWGSACVFWCLEEIKEVQWLYASDGLNCAYQLTTKSRFRSGEWLFPSCLQWQGLSQCMNILKTLGIEHLIHPVILTKTHSRLYSDPANEENVTSDLLINKQGKAQ